MSVFTNFPSDPYIFLEVERTAQGTLVKEEYTANGIFKLRDGMTEADSLESETSDATLRVRPDEPFAANNMVGQCVRIQREQGEEEYRILSQVEGYDHDLEVMDFWLLELKREKVLWAELSSPLV